MGTQQIILQKYKKRLADIKKRCHGTFDITFRRLETNLGEVTIIFIDNMSNMDLITEHIVEPLITKHIAHHDIHYMMREIIEVGIVEEVMTEEDAIQHILTGHTVVLFSFTDKYAYCETKSYSGRVIEEPMSEAVIKGSREGFVENLEDNICLIRRRVKSHKLKFEKLSIGSNSHTNVVLTYLEGEAPDQLLDYIRQRLCDMEVEYLPGSYYIDERLQEKRSFLDTIGYTEKPDVAVALMTEGRALVLADNSPFAITAPHFFIENFSVADDYYLNKYTQNYFKLIRWTAFFISLLLPGIYLAIMTYHFKLVPTVLAFRLAVTRAGVPFPTVVEVGIMMFFFQVLREAGIRLPRPIGSALSIVGALILGDAAVGAGLTSQITVLIIALSSISLFLNPKLYGGVVLWSNIIIFFSSVLGLPGFYVGFILFCSHIAGLTSCGYPFLYPMGTFKKFGFKDLLIRGDLREVSGNIFKRGKKP